MKVEFNAQYKKENISGYAIVKEFENRIEAIQRSIERRIKKEIYSLSIDHRNSDGGTQYSGQVVKYNKYAGCCDDLGTITVWV